MPTFIPGKTCRICGAPIPWRAGVKRRERAVFCSDRCKFTWQRQPENGPNYRGSARTAICQAPACGREFSYYPSIRPNAEACSNACRHTLHSLKMTGRRPSNGIYTSSSTFRNLIRREFYDRCAICGWDEAPCDIAHIVSRKDGGTDTLENVTMLCPNHHRLFDQGLIPIQEVQESRQRVLRLEARILDDA